MDENKQALKLLLTTPTWKLVSEFNKNKDLIKDAASSREGYNDIDGAAGKIAGVTVGIFVVLVIISIALYIWAIVLLVKHGKTMPTWAVITSIIFLFFGFPILPIILVFVTKNTKRKSSFF